MREGGEKGEVGRKELGNSEESGPGEVGGAWWRGLGPLVHLLGPLQESLPLSLVGRGGIEGNPIAQRLQSESHSVRSNCTVHGILQARILEWVAFLFSRGSS